MSRLRIWRIFILISSVLLSVVFWFIVWGIQAEDFAFALVFGIPLAIFIPGLLLSQIAFFVVWFRKMGRRDKFLFFVPFLAIILEILIAVFYVYVIEPEMKVMAARRYLKEASDKKDILVCKEIDHTYPEAASLRDRCFNSLISTVEDPAVCEQLGPITPQHFCYKTVAYKNNNISLCEKIGWGNVSEECYEKFIKDTNSAEVCEALSNESYHGLRSNRDDCRIKAAELLKDTSLCDDLRYNDRDYCYDQVEKQQDK